jgi:hypothetical protein
MAAPRVEARVVTDVQVGTAVIAYVEPHEGQAQAFNRWYERDHMYAATTAGPGAFAGARWVATRACKAVRPRDATWFGDPARGSYLTTVWLLDDTQAEWDAWVSGQMERLRAEPDRMFAGRDHLQTGVYRFVVGCRAAGGVSVATAIDHPHAGVVLLAVPPGAAAETAAALVSDDVPTVAAFAQERSILTTTEPPAHQLVVGFTATDPLALWAARVEPLLAGVGFASPFLRTIPGTDAYTDDL